MTDNEIIKALECCTPTYEKVCGKCIYNEYKSHGISAKQCSEYMREDLFNLICRQKAEIERLKEEVKIHIKKSVAKRKYDRALIESEAIKDFTEGLKEYGRNTLLTNRIIDNFTKVYLKETAGDNDESTL